MKKEKIFDHLNELAKRLDIKVRVEKGDFAGGYCTKDEEPVIVINKRHMLDKRINVLAREVATFDLQGIDIPPPVLKIIESERKRATEVELELPDSDEE